MTDFSDEQIQIMLRSNPLILRLYGWSRETSQPSSNGRQRHTCSASVHEAGVKSSLLPITPYSHLRMAGFAPLKRRNCGSECEWRHHEVSQGHSVKGAAPMELSDHSRKGEAASAYQAAQPLRRFR